MKRLLAGLALLSGTGQVLAQAGTACVFSTAELAAPLGHTPQAGVESTDRLGMPSCRYGMKDAKGRHFSVRLVTKCDQEKFDAHAKTMQSLSGKANRAIAGVGDGAYYSPGGTAAARAGGRCVQLSGLAAGATRPVSEADAGKLLSLAVSRVGK